MNNFYTILINDDHTFTHTNIVKIMTRSHMVDTIRFLVNPHYNDLDLAGSNAVLEYVTPISHTYKPILLKPSPELYKGKVEYLVPVTSDFTTEAGDLKLTINFSDLQIVNDQFVQKVRKVGTTTIKIHESVQWSDYIAASNLDNIAQMLLTNQSIVEQNKETMEELNQARVTNLKISEDKKDLYLVNNDDEQVGNKVRIKDLNECEDGIPVVDFEPKDEEESSNMVDNVVDF